MSILSQNTDVKELKNNISCFFLNLILESFLTSAISLKKRVFHRKRQI